jgi:glycosyltransferase involved in cell wall biosynthesis
MATAVLHVTSAEGGGADRYVRDVAATTSPRHWIWHAGAGVVEDTARRRYFAPPDDVALARWLDAAAIGVVHLHGVAPECLAIVARIAAAAPRPHVVTLHDVGFVAPRAFEGDADIDRTAIDRVAPALAAADAVIAPSAFIASLYTGHFAGANLRMIAPGIEVPAPPSGDPRSADADFAPLARKLRIAVAGAIGPHKGSDVLPILAAAIAPLDATLVVVGYTADRLERGWQVPGTLYVHGAYEDGSLGAWLDAYGVGAVMFANRMPESFSYTLSEAWAARRPAIVPDAGALGERVAAHGGGWRLSAPFAAAECAALIERLAGPAGAREIAQVESAIDVDDARRIPTLAAMSESFEALYARYAQPGPADGDDALAPLLAANLDGRVFRRELVRLTQELGQTNEWHAKLERDIAALKAAIDKLDEDNRRLRDVRDAFAQLPEVAQKYLIKRTFRERR